VTPSILDTFSASPFQSFLSLHTKDLHRANDPACPTHGVDNYSNDNLLDAPPSQLSTDSIQYTGCTLSNIHLD
jgi:hypothetical protein